MISSTSLRRSIVGPIGCTSRGPVLIGAAVALFAAYLAWRAVSRQISANAGQLKKQIDANREDVNDQLAAEAKHASVQNG